MCGTYGVVFACGIFTLYECYVCALRVAFSCMLRLFVCHMGGVCIVYVWYGMGVLCGCVLCFCGVCIVYEL